MAEMRIFGFNTGRLYQADGQRISVGVTSDGDVLFRDHSRGIDGKLHWQHDIDGDPTAATVMLYYDKNLYSYDPRANWLDAKEWPPIQHSMVKRPINTRNYL